MGLLFTWQSHDGYGLLVFINALAITLPTTLPRWPSIRIVFVKGTGPLFLKLHATKIVGDLEAIDGALLAVSLSVSEECTSHDFIVVAL